MVSKSSVLLVFILLFCAGLCLAGETAPPQVGSSLPELELPLPDNSSDLKYLGLSSGGKTFKVNRLKAKLVIIQVYSMYCPYCQAEAVNVNRLYGLIENNPALKDKIKIIGIGAGNTLFEVGTYRKKYKVEFPLLPDGDFRFHKMLGEVRTPYFIAVKPGDKGANEVIYSRLGAIENIELFLDRLVKAVQP